jgi:hypothetical protein
MRQPPLNLTQREGVRSVAMERTWTVGELARESGLTVRALHHYMGRVQAA